METLVVIDVQKGYMKPEYAGLPDRIRKHIDHSGYDHILFGKFMNQKGSNFVRLLGQDNFYDPEETNIVPELADLAVPERTFERTAYSLFKSSKFRAYLEGEGIRRMDLCGLVADSCVLATAFEGFDLGYEMRVLRRPMETKENLIDPTEAIFKRNIDRRIP